MTSPIESDLLAVLQAEGIRSPRLLSEARAVPRAEFSSRTPPRWRTTTSRSGSRTAR